MADDQPEQYSQATETPKPTSLQWKCLDFSWLVFTWPGRFKCGEFITTFLGFVLISAVNLFDEEPRYEFYVFVGVFSWVMVFIHMLLGIPHLIEKLPAVVTQPFVFFVLCAIAVFSWLIASSLVAAKDRDNSTVQAGAAFGFFSMFLFLLESAYYFVRWRREGSTSSRSTNKEMNQTASGDYVPEDPTY